MNKNPVFFWQNRILKKIFPDDIHCLVMDRNYTNIFVTKTDYVMVRCTLDSALKMLPADEFVKIHRSYAVSINFIDEIGTDYVRVTGTDIPLSKQYSKSLKAKLRIMGKKPSLAEE